MATALADIGLDEIAGAQQLALVRLHTKVTGETHRLLIEFGQAMRAEVLRVVEEGGELGPLNYFGLEQYAREQWTETFNKWERLFAAARRQAAWIPFGQLACQHGHVMGAVRALRERRFQEQVLKEFASVVQAMERRVDAILNNSAALAYSDGKNLSGRIWSLDQESRRGITLILQEAAVTGESAWNAAKKLEQYLGAGQECPRWTSTRLYQLTKTDIALGDERGLIRGSPCESRGVAYNALRLARNEIQIAHHMATDETFARMPWVEEEQIVLSPDHPPIPCECPDVAGGGKNGDGVYPKGEVVLPIHPQCIPGGQAVETSRGDCLIEDVQIGDLVLTHEGRLCAVIETFVHLYEGDLVKVRTRAGREILVTPDHPILADGTWRAAAALEVGATLLVPPNGSAPGNQSGRDEGQ